MAYDIAEHEKTRGPTDLSCNQILVIPGSIHTGTVPYKNSDYSKHLLRPFPGRPPNYFSRLMYQSKSSINSKNSKNWDGHTDTLNSTRRHEIMTREDHGQCSTRQQSRFCSGIRTRLTLLVWRLITYFRLLHPDIRLSTTSSVATSPPSMLRYQLNLSTSALMISIMPWPKLQSSGKGQK